jgi:hypothetical protein
VDFEAALVWERVGTGPQLGAPNDPRSAHVVPDRFNGCRPLGPDGTAQRPLLFIQDPLRPDVPSLRTWWHQAPDCRGTGGGTSSRVPHRTACGRMPYVVPIETYTAPGLVKSIKVLSVRSRRLLVPSLGRRSEGWCPAPAAVRPGASEMQHVVGPRFHGGRRARP